MTQLTNKMRLPESIVRAVSNDEYTKHDADFSCTELLQPPQVARLRRQHSNDIVEDVSDRVWSLLGQSVHSVVERASKNLDDVLSEVTLITDFEGVRIKGTLDHVTLSRAELNDFKVTTAWKLKGGQVPDEWAQQTNIYRWLLWREMGIVINSIAIIGLLRDWSKLEAARSPDYPQAQVVRLDVPVWDMAEVERFVRQRINEHTAEEVRPCTDEERWLKPAKFAVMKGDQTRAVKLFDNRSDAQVFINSSKDGPKLRIEERPREATRCLHYCPASAFCPQWQAEKQADQSNLPFNFGEST